MNGNDHPNRLATVAPLLALVTFLAGAAVVVFPTREDMHRHVAHSVRPVADHIHQHAALPTHPAQQRWSDVLHKTMLSLNQRLERLEVQLVRLQTALARKCPEHTRGDRT